MMMAAPEIRNMISPRNSSPPSRARALLSDRHSSNSGSRHPPADSRPALETVDWASRPPPSPDGSKSRLPRRNWISATTMLHGQRSLQLSVAAGHYEAGARVRASSASGLRQRLRPRRRSIQRPMSSKRSLRDCDLAGAVLSHHTFGMKRRGTVLV